MYGYFPSGERHSFVFLLGLYKSADNDRKGKNIAKARLKLLRQGKGNTHEFDFEERITSEDSQGAQD